MISDKFSNCARPEIQEDVIFRGQKVRVAKEWKDYTDQEKANAINYKFGCGIDIVVFMLELERQFESLKLQFQTANAAAPPAELNDNFTKLDQAIISMKSELERRVTPEYLGRLENALYSRIDQVDDRVKAIETRPAQIEADAAVAALPPDIEAR